MGMRTRISITLDAGNKVPCSYTNREISSVGRDPNLIVIRRSQDLILHFTKFFQKFPMYCDE